MFTSAKTTLNRGRHRRLFTLVASIVAIAVLIVGGLGMANRAQAATPGCSYGTSGPHSGTICWLDFSAFDATQAATVSGQPFSILLPGGYKVAFELTWEHITGTNPPFVASSPTWSGSAFGNTVYTGVQGKPALGSSAGTIRYTVRNVQVTDPTNAPVTGYSLVSMDAEAMSGSEGQVWRSDQPLDLLAMAPTSTSFYGCATPTGLGTTTVNCVGGKDGAPIVTTKDASWISADVTGAGVQDVAFGMEFANLEVRTAFDQLVDPADSVDTMITTPQGTVLGTSSSAGALSATTGSVTILPVGQFTLAEAVTPGNSMLLNNYTANWSCTNVNANGTTTTVLPFGSALTQSVTPIAGDDIVCTVTYTAKTRSLALTKRITSIMDVNQNNILDEGDQISYDFTVTNTGQLAMHGVQVTDPKLAGVSCAATSLAPGTSTACRGTGSYVVASADVQAGTIDNTATVSALPPGSDNPDARVFATSSVSVAIGSGIPVVTPPTTPAVAPPPTSTEAPGTPNTGLARTGAGQVGALIGGLVLVVSGAILIVVARRRVRSPLAKYK